MDGPIVAGAEDSSIPVVDDVRLFLERNSRRRNAQTVHSWYNGVSSEAAGMGERGRCIRLWGCHPSEPEEEDKRLVVDVGPGIGWLDGHSGCINSTGPRTA
jgi:hypothetical protein